MSDNIPPVEIQMEIMKQLPVKSLIQFRSVSKTWKSIIESNDFIAAHHHHTHHHRLLVYCDRPVDDDPNYVSFADNHSFPQHKVSLTAPLLVNKLKYLSVDNIVGSSRGLFCFSGYLPYKHIAVIWNPCIRRVVPVLVPKEPGNKFMSRILGFGVCPVTNDPKIIKIRYINRHVHDVERISHIPSQVEVEVEVEVFTLSTGVWRRPYNNLPPKSVSFYKSAVDVDGFLYWLAEDMIVMDDGGGYTRRNVIISFDLSSEEFRQVNLPHSLAHGYYNNISISKLRESLLVSQADNHVNINVWLMEGGLAKSFSKLYTVNVDTWVSGFRRSGEPIIVVYEKISDEVHLFSKLAAYDPYSKCINCFWTGSMYATFKVYPYMETLLLLDQTNLAVYNEKESIRFLDDLVL